MGLNSENIIPDNEYLDLIKNVNFEPIFILGYARSGTTVLYKFLSDTKCFNFFKIYHIVKYNEILFNYLNGKEEKACLALDELYKDLGVSSRIYDEVEVSANTPEEYRIILQNAGYLPPFRETVSLKNIKQLWLGGNLSDFFFNALKVNPNNLTLFTESCKKLKFVSGKDLPLILKNPWDFSNFIYLKSVFPKAKFIFIHRDPVHVLNSQLKALRSAMVTKNPYLTVQSKAYRRLFNSRVELFALRLLFSSPLGADMRVGLMTKNLVETATYFMDNINSLSDTEYISVKYEDLCEAPDTIVSQIMQFLGMDLNLGTTYSKLIKPRQIQLLPEVERQYEYLYKKLQPYCAYNSYKS